MNYCGHAVNFTTKKKSYKNKKKIRLPREDWVIFKDTHGTLTEEQVKTETARCLGCGTTVVDANRCIGCGICTTKCKFDAITLHRDVPKASNMVVAEDKFKHILPNMVKRGVKILFAPKSKADKAFVKACKKAAKAQEKKD